MNKVKYITEITWESSTPEDSHLLPSVTEPDQTYTVAELLERHRNGILTDTELHRDTEYTEGAEFDTPDFEKFKDMDLVDQFEYFEKVHADLKASKEDLERKAKEKADQESKEYQEYLQKKKEGFFQETESKERPTREHVTEEGATRRTKGSRPKAV